MNKRLGVRERLEQALGAGIVATSSLPVGFGRIGLRIEVADGRKLAVKARQDTDPTDLRLEAYMLEELRRHSELPVPAVHVAEPDLLVIDFIETDGGAI